MPQHANQEAQEIEQQRLACKPSRTGQKSNRVSTQPRRKFADATQCRTTEQGLTLPAGQSGHEPWLAEGLYVPPTQREQVEAAPASK